MVVGEREEPTASGWISRLPCPGHRERLVRSRRLLRARLVVSFGASRAARTPVCRTRSGHMSAEAGGTLGRLPRLPGPVEPGRSKCWVQSYQAPERRLRIAFASCERPGRAKRHRRPATVAGMRVLVVGSGGVGSAFVAIASQSRGVRPHHGRRHRPRARPRRPSRPRRQRPAAVGSRPPQSTPATRRPSPSWPALRRRRDPQRLRPTLQPADLRGRVRRRTATTSTWRCTCREPHPTTPVREDAASGSATASSRSTRCGRTAT